MTAALLAGLILGLMAGLAPGPYTTMVAATGLERGFRAAVPLAMAPLLTDVVPLIATVLLLTSLSPQAITWMGLIGGAVLVLIGLRLSTRYRGRAESPSGDLHAPATVRFADVVAGTLFSPAPWLFWIGIGTPIFVRHWRADWREGAAFLLVLFAANIGSASALAWAAAHGRRVLAPFWRQRMLRFMGVGLILAGIFLVWQGVTGESMQVDPARVQELLGQPGSLQ